MKFSNKEFISELEDGVSELEDISSVSELEDGVSELEDGISELEDISSVSGLLSEQAKNEIVIANNMKERLSAAKVVLWVMVLPRNKVAKHLMIPCTNSGFPALALRVFNPAFAITVAGLLLIFTRLP